MQQIALLSGGRRASLSFYFRGVLLLNNNRFITKKEQKNKSQNVKVYKKNKKLKIQKKTFFLQAIYSHNPVAVLIILTICICVRAAPTTISDFAYFAIHPSLYFLILSHYDPSFFQINIKPYFKKKHSIQNYICRPPPLI